MRWVTWLSVNIIALAVALALLGGLSIQYNHPPTEGRKIFAVVLIGALLGVINKFVRPIVTVLAIPAIVLTLGFALLLVNAAMLALTATITKHFNDQTIGFHLHVAGFWTAVAGGLIITIASWATSLVIEKISR
jgi:putative membrane protein